MVPQTPGNSKNVRPKYFSLYSSICKPKVLIDDDYVHQKYVVEGLNMSQIAREINTSRQAIRERLLKMGVTLRSKIDQKHNQKHNKYGYKRVKGQTIGHKSELRAASIILEMRQKGLSFQDIANILHEIKIPTKKKGKRWTKGMVRNIFFKS